MKQSKSVKAALTLGVLGIVFGDISASPLYALQTLFRVGRIPLTEGNLYGIVSMIIWAMVIVVVGKYLWLITRADNDGEGGILALTSLLRGKLKTRPTAITLTIGLIGLVFFYADSMITPALTMLSALDGVRLVAPHLTQFIVPTAIVLLVGLFIAQSRGSAVIGRWFGPLILMWLVMSGIAGLAQVIAHPQVLVALSPLTAIGFIVHHPAFSFLALTAVTLALTGVEALYADMGHFGRLTIRRAWFFVAFPALALNYIGQAALTAADPAAASHTIYYALYPEVLRIPVIVIATVVTLTASQAVIAGMFSLTRQAVRLGYLPPMFVRHTSAEEAGQVYIGVMNWLACVVVVALVILFNEGTYLAAALGIAVSGTWLIDGILFAVVAAAAFKWSKWLVLPFVIVFVGFDVLLVVANIQNIWIGGWLTIVIAATILFVVLTWIRGRAIVGRERRLIEGSLDDFVLSIRRRRVHLARPHGCAVYLSHHSGVAPLALRASVDQLHELMSTVIIVNVVTLDIPHVSIDMRATIDELRFPDDGISHVTLQFGFNDIPNVPRALEYVRDRTPELKFYPATATYFVSDKDIAIIKNHRMLHFRKVLFAWLHRNATKTTTYFHLPYERTIDMASYIDL